MPASCLSSLLSHLWEFSSGEDARRSKPDVGCLTTLFQMKPVKGRSGPLYLKRCQATLIDRLPEEDPSQKRVSGEEETEMSPV